MKFNFKVGDWVKCIDSTGSVFLQRNAIYQVAECDSENPDDIRVWDILQLNPYKESHVNSRLWMKDRFIPVTYSEAYEYWLSITKLKVGNEVRVAWKVKGCGPYFGWSNCWTAMMDKAVGGIYKVTDLNLTSSHGVTLEFPTKHTLSNGQEVVNWGNYQFPFFCLETVPKKKKVVPTKAHKDISKNSYCCTFENQGELTALVAVAQANSNLKSNHSNFSFEARKGSLFYLRENLNEKLSTCWGFCVNDAAASTVFKKVSFQKMVEILSSYTPPPIKVELPVVLQFGQTERSLVSFKTATDANYNKIITEIKPHDTLTLKEWEKVFAYVKMYNKCGGVEIREREKSK